MMDINERQILKPWSVKEAIPVKQAGRIAGRCAETVRMWAEDGIDGPPHPIWRGSGQASKAHGGWVWPSRPCSQPRDRTLYAVGCCHGTEGDPA